MGKHRPASERLAEIQEKARKLAAKAAQEQVSEHPEIRELDERIKGLRTSLLKWNRWASEGKEKAEKFRQRAQLWEQRAEKAETERASILAEVDSLKSERQSLAERLAEEILASNA